MRAPFLLLRGRSSQKSTRPRPRLSPLPRPRQRRPRPRDASEGPGKARACLRCQAGPRRRSARAREESCLCASARSPSLFRSLSPSLSPSFGPRAPSRSVGSARRSRYSPSLLFFLRRGRADCLRWVGGVGFGGLGRGERGRGSLGRGVFLEAFWRSLGASLFRVWGGCGSGVEVERFRLESKQGVEAEGAGLKRNARGEAPEMPGSPLQRGVSLTSRAPPRPRPPPFRFARTTPVSSC